MIIIFSENRMGHMLKSMRKKLLLSLCLLVGLTAVLAGCTTEKQEDAPSAGIASNEKVVTMSWPRDIGPMNPHLYNPSQMFAQSMIFESLVAYKDGKIEPNLAESWTVSPDGKVYTFKIRPNVQFSDGTPFTAKNVKRNFDAFMNNKNMHTWLGMVNMLDKTEAVDHTTFKLTLKEAYYPTLYDLAVVRPVRFLADAGFPDNGDTSKEVKKPIGTGPWVLSEYKRDEYAVFTPNEHYWGDKPKVEKIIVKVIPDGETRALAFEKGDLDLIYGEGVISFDAYQQLQQTGNYVTKLSEPIGARDLVLNTMNPKLADIRVRQALHHGFNKQAMVEGVTLGMEEKADNILPPNLPYANVAPMSVDYNVEQAKALLDQAGWILPAGKTIREKEGQPLQLELIYDKADLVQKSFAETLQAEWANIGVKLDITGVELTVYIQRRKANDFDMNFYSTFGAPYDPHSFMTAVIQNGYGVSDTLVALPMKAELDKEVKEGMSTTDEQLRTKLFGSVLTTLQEQSSIIPISYIKKIALYQKRVTQFNFPSNRDEHPFYGIDTK